MWRDEAFLHFRRSILATHRNSFHAGYFISWDKKKRRATPLENGWKYRIYQIFVLFCILVVLPTLCLNWGNLIALAFSREGADVVEVWFASLGIVYLLIGIQFMWNFVWPEGPKKFVNVYESLLNLEKKLQGDAFIYLRDLYLHLVLLRWSFWVLPSFASILMNQKPF